MTMEDVWDLADFLARPHPPRYADWLAERDRAEMMDDAGAFGPG